MNAELISGLEKEVAAIKQRIASARADLQGIEEGESRAIALHKISALETLLASVTGARDAIARGEHEAEESPKQFRRWREAVAKLRDAKVAVEAFQRPIEKVQLAVDQAEKSFEIARAALTDHRAHPIENPDFASRSMIQRWEARCAELQTAVDERSATLRSLKEKIAQLRRDWLRATEHFNACALTERVTKPRPTKVEEHKDFGTLSSVA